MPAGNRPLTRARRKAPARPPRMSALLGLQKVDLFKGLDSYTLREIAAQCKWTRCKRNQVVIRRDGTDRDVYFVIAGQVRVTALAGRGRRIIFRELAAGEVFGEHSAIDGRARFADVLALRESLLASMSPEVFRAILANHASVRERLLRRLTGSVRELTDRLLELGAQPVQRRIWLELARLAREAGVAQNHARLEPAPTHSDVASRVGTSREEVSREFSRLAREGGGVERRPVREGARRAHGVQPRKEAADPFEHLDVIELGPPPAAPGPRAPGEAGAERDHHDGRTVLDSPRFDCLVERDRNRRGRRVAVFVHVHVNLVHRDSGVLGRCLDDANVRLVGNEKIDVRASESSAIERPVGCV